MRASRSVFIAACLLLTAAAAMPATNAGPPDTTGATAAAPPVTMDELKVLKDQILSRTDIDADAKAQAAENCDNAIAQLQAEADWTARSADFEKAILEAPARLAALKADLAAPAAEPSIDVPPDVTLAALEQRQQQAETELAAAQQEAADLNTELQRRTERRNEVPRLAAAAQSRLAEVSAELTTLLASGDQSVTADSQKVFLEARKRAVTAEISAYEKEIASYTARGELLTARRDAAARRVSRAEAVAKMWRDSVAERRRREAALAARQAEERLRQLASADPRLRAIAEDNAHLAERRRDLAVKLDELSRETIGVKAVLTELVERAASAKRKVEAAPELTRPVSILLRNQRSQIPDVREYSRRVDKSQKEVSDVWFEVIQYQEERTKLADVERSIQEIASSLVPDLASPEYANAAKIVRDLLEVKRANLEQLLEDLEGKYLTGLVDLALDEQRVVSEAENFIRFIDERIVWYRSTESISVRDLQDCGTFLAWFFSLSNWKNVLVLLLADLRANPAVYFFALCGLGALRFLGRRVPKLMHGLSDRVLSASTDKFSHSLVALAATLVSATWWPLLVGFAAVRLYIAGDSSEFAKAVAVGLSTVAVVLATLEFIRISCKDGGLADTHFRWRRAAMTTVTANLRWFAPLVLPAAFVVSVVNWQREYDAWRESVARVALIASLMLLAVFLQRLLRPSGKLMEDVMRRHRGGWLERLRFVWYPLLVFLPVAIALGSAAGFQYTAYQLSSRLAYSLWLALALAIVNAFMLRWLFVAHRRLAVEAALRRRTAEMEARAERGEPAAEGAEAVQEPEIDIFSMSAQTRQLLRAFIWVAAVVGLWFIWSDTLPALGFLHSFKLWRVDAETYVTLQNVLMAVIVVMMTVVAGKNIPGLLEISVLQKLPLDHGVRFAVTTVARYLITVVGLIVAFGVIGIGWSKVQWLVAAVSVGLGFGLQEIFGNFISGLMILYERPMRVGDTVTVGNVTGTVTRIQIRATTIRDWERKELVVPNKEFITGQLVNWTLSDSILRVTVPVGIEYGSDTRKAYDLLMKVAREHPNVLEDPPPSALFIGFGDSSLNFELRAFIAGIEHFLKVRHDLHLAIDDAFRKAGIVIAFPQRDIHIRSFSQAVPLEGRQAAAALDPPQDGPPPENPASRG